MERDVLVGMAGALLRDRETHPEALQLAQVAVPELMKAEAVRESGAAEQWLEVPALDILRVVRLAVCTAPAPDPTVTGLRSIRLGHLETANSS
jgi:hypothetical protein